MVLLSGVEPPTYYYEPTPRSGFASLRIGRSASDGPVTVIVLGVAENVAEFGG